MKKALSFAVALGLVAGMASAAAASDLLDFHGEARIRALNGDITQKASTSADGKDMAQKARHYDHRYRFVMNAKAADNVTVQTRLTLMSQLFGNNIQANTWGTVMTNPAATSNDVVLDRAKIVIEDMPILGGQWSAGRMEASWGNKLMAWGANADRIKALYKVGGGNTLGGFIEKGAEFDNASLDGDVDKYSLLYIGKAGDTKYGVIGVYADNDNHALNNGDGVQGEVLDAYFTTKAGPATILGEVFYRWDDMFKAPGTNDGEDLGMFVGGAVGAGEGVTVKGLVAYVQDNQGNKGGGADCDDDFAPSLMIGTCQQTAIIDFGTTTSAGATTSDDSSYLVGAGVDVKVGDKTTVGALVGYLMASEYAGNGTEDGTLVEVDVTLQYAIAQNTTFAAGIGYGFTDKMYSLLGTAAADGDEDIYTMGWSVTTSW
jgi:hypothetical protein